VRYAVIASCRSLFSIRMMCRLLRVSSSGFYARQTRPKSCRAKANAELAACRHRRCVSRVQVPRKELFVHLSSTGKLRRSNPGWKFPMGKATGCSAREPRRSLVTQLEMPTLWSEGEGRCLRDSNEHPPSGSSGVAGAACRGRDTVQDGRPTAVRAQNSQPRRIRATEIAEGRRGSRRGS